MFLIFSKKFNIDFQNRKWNFPSKKLNYLSPHYQRSILGITAQPAKTNYRSVQPCIMEKIQKIDTKFDLFTKFWEPYNTKHFTVYILGKMLWKCDNTNIVVEDGHHIFYKTIHEFLLFNFPVLFLSFPLPLVPPIPSSMSAICSGCPPPPAISSTSTTSFPLDWKVLAMWVKTWSTFLSFFTEVWN